ncbi:MAG: type II secretion system protein [Verrucomicrobiota bacterium]
MKARHSDSRTAFTLMEVLIVVALLGFLAVMFLPKARVKNRAQRITCVNNLKQVWGSFRVYAGDHFDRYPMNISTNDKPIVNEATPVSQYFQMIQNELGTPKMVVCPSDSKRTASKDFTNFNNSNISYFIGLDSNENLPQTILAGDRNITNGFVPRNGILELTKKQTVKFTDEIHLKQGDIALGDGSVQQVSSKRLRSEIIPKTGMATNRIKLPELN